MKRILSWLCLTILLYSCQTGSTGSPKNTVNKFIEASRQGNLEEVKKYITKSDVGMLEIGESFLSKLDPNGAQNMKDKMSKQFKEKTKDAKIEIKDEKIEGDNATVNVTFIQEGRSETRPFSLLKEDGIWKVSLLSTGMKNSGSNELDIQKTMKDINLDSLQGTINEGMKEFNKMDKDSLKSIIEQGMKDVEKLKDLPKNN